MLCGGPIKLLEFPMANHRPQSRLPSTPAISPTPNPNVTKRENKSNNSVSHYSVCQQMVPISSVCERGRDTMWMFCFPYILSSHTKLFVLLLHLLGSSFLSRPLSSPNSVSMPTTLILRFKITHSLFLVLSLTLFLSLYLFLPLF